MLQRTGSTDAHPGGFHLSRRWQNIRSQDRCGIHLDLTFSAFGNVNLVESDILLAMESERFHHLHDFTKDHSSIYDVNEDLCLRIGTTMI